MLIVWVLLACLVGLVVYGQFGLLLGNYWYRSRKWRDEDLITITAIFWPVAALIFYLFWPVIRGFWWLMVAPQRRIEARQERQERSARERRLEQERRELARAEAERAAQVAQSPAVELDQIKAQLATHGAAISKLQARKAELERRPDSTRH